ncbi:MAG TPA: response regulator transcription factor [Gaiellaceae bacterium]|nr:response regulator transcription factor [Gaiellaceae bacterium]
MSAAVIVAEPETLTRGFLERHLADDGFQVLGASAPAEALALAEQVRPDLVLVTELELCLRLRAGEPGRSWDRDVPVILLGGLEGDVVDRVRALDRGADDYLDRPFSYEELLARIRAVLRRTAPRATDVLRAGELEIDRPTRCVRVGGRRISLPAKEYELLVKLAEHPWRVFTKDELLREVWGFRAMGRTRTLDSHASRLRRKIAAMTETPYVINEWGVGYRLMLPA